MAQEPFGGAHRHHPQLESKLFASGLHGWHGALVVGRRGIPENTNPAREWHRLFQHLKLLGDNTSEQVRKSRDVPTGPRQARHMPDADWISMYREHDGDRPGRLSGCLQ